MIKSQFFHCIKTLNNYIEITHSSVTMCTKTYPHQTPQISHKSIPFHTCGYLKIILKILVPWELLQKVNPNGTHMNTFMCV